jgi:TolB protein
MRLNSILVGLSFLVLFPRVGAAQSQQLREAELQDVLGPLVVEATRPEQLGRKLISVALEPSLASTQADVVLHTVVGRDLDLSGDFRVLASKELPFDTFTTDEAPDLAAWRHTGIEALVRLRGSTDPDGKSNLSAEIYLLTSTNNPLFHKSFPAEATSLRRGAHRVADAVIGALTGHDGGFASHLAFASTNRGSRRAFTIDADGHDQTIASGGHDVVSTAVFGTNDELFYAASVKHGPFRLYEAPKPDPLQFFPDASIYSLAFDVPRGVVAMALGTGGSVGVFVGRWGAPQLEPSSKTEMAFHPAFSPTGKLAYVGVGTGTSRIYVDHKPVSPRVLRATAPVFCNHPRGTQLIYAVGVGERTDLVASDERGHGLRRLTQGPGTNSHPACSPDGRLVAFFSNRTSHEGPGLYVLPLMGGRPKKISSTMGDSLSWAAWQRR